MYLSVFNKYSEQI